MCAEKWHPTSDFVCVFRNRNPVALGIISVYPVAKRGDERSVRSHWGAAACCAEVSCTPVVATRLTEKRIVPRVGSAASKPMYVGEWAAEVEERRRRRRGRRAALVVRADAAATMTIAVRALRT